MTNRSQRRRIAELEKRSKSNAAPHVVLTVGFVQPNGQFGGEPCRSDYAKCGECVWYRAQDETPGDFERRVTTILEKERHGHVAIAIFYPNEEVSVI